MADKMASLPPASPAPPDPPTNDTELFAPLSIPSTPDVIRLYRIWEGVPFFAPEYAVSYLIEDNYGRGVYRLKGYRSSFGPQLSVQDLTGHELAFYSQIYPGRFEVLRHGKTIARIVQSWRRPKIEVLGPNGYTIEAVWPKWIFFRLPWKLTARLVRDGRAVGLAAPSWVNMADTEDPVMILALAWFGLL